MLTLLRQAVERIGKDNIDRIIIRPCSTHLNNAHLNKPQCGIYSVDIELKEEAYEGDRKNGHQYMEAAYIPIEEGQKLLTVDTDLLWRGKGSFEELPIEEELTGGACIFCDSKFSGKSLEEALIEYERIASQDSYALYLKPYIMELRKFQEKMGL